MAMSDIIRPRLSRPEVEFIAEVLAKYYESVEQKLRELEACRRRVDVLRDKFIMYPGRFHKQLKQEKQRLQELKESSSWSEEFVSREIAERFKKLAEGKPLHNSHVIERSLRRRYQ